MIGLAVFALLLGYGQCNLQLLTPQLLVPTFATGCYYHGSFYPLGWFRTNPCESCMCNNRGQVTCMFAECLIPPLCSDPVHEKDNCCPTCPNVYCAPCVLFGSQRDDAKERTFTKLRPVTDWSNLSKYVSRHFSEGSSHHDNVRASERFLRLQETGKADVMGQLSSYHQEVIERNRHILGYTCKAPDGHIVKAGETYHLNSYTSCQCDIHRMYDFSAVCTEQDPSIP